MTSWYKLTMADSGSIGVGNIDTQTPSDNGAVISSNNIYFQSASTIDPGMVNNTSQSFSGKKTFTNAIVVDNVTIDSTAMTPYNFNLPTTAGSSGQFLTSGGGLSNEMTWSSATGPALFTLTTSNPSSITFPTSNSISASSTGIATTVESYQTAFFTCKLATTHLIADMTFGLDTTFGSTSGSLHNIAYGFYIQFAAYTLVYAATYGKSQGTSIPYAAGQIYSIEITTNGVNYYVNDPTTGLHLICSLGSPNLSQPFFAEFNINSGDSVTDISFGYLAGQINTLSLTPPAALTIAPYYILGTGNRSVVTDTSTTPANTIITSTESYQYAYLSVVIPIGGLQGGEQIIGLIDNYLSGNVYGIYVDSSNNNIYSWYNNQKQVILDSYISANIYNFYIQATNQGVFYTVYQPSGSIIGTDSSPNIPGTLYQTYFYNLLTNNNITNIEFIPSGSIGPALFTLQNISGNNSVINIGPNNAYAVYAGVMISGVGIVQTLESYPSVFMSYTFSSAIPLSQYIGLYDITSSSTSYGFQFNGTNVFPYNYGTQITSLSYTTNQNYKIIATSSLINYYINGILVASTTNINPTNLHAGQITLSQTGDNVLNICFGFTESTTQSFTLIQPSLSTTALIPSPNSCTIVITTSVGSQVNSFETYPIVGAGLYMRCILPAINTTDPVGVMLACGFSNYYAQLGTDGINSTITFVATGTSSTFNYLAGDLLTIYLDGVNANYTITGSQTNYWTASISTTTAEFLSFYNANFTTSITDSYTFTDIDIYTTGTTAVSMGANYYLNASQVAPFQIGGQPTYYMTQTRTIQNSSAIYYQIHHSSTSRLLFSFLTDINDPEQTLINAGIWTIYLYVSINILSSTYFTISTYDQSGNIALLGTSNVNVFPTGISSQIITYNIPLNTTSINPSDRILLQAYGGIQQTSGNGDFYASFEGTTYSYMTSTIPIIIPEINPNILTTYTDFGINLPNYGINWISIESDFGVSHPISIAMSASGQYQSVCCSNQTIYYSDNFGVNWSLYTTSTALNYPWSSIAISSSGQYQVACTNNSTTEYIWISTNYGVNWNFIITTGAPSDIFSDITISSNGQYILASAVGGVWVSPDQGTTWINPITFQCNNVAISASGQYQSFTTINAGGTSNGIYISSNYGISWIQSNADNTQNFFAIDMSANGEYQIASTSSTGIYISINFGNTWNRIFTKGPISINGYSLTISATGQYQSATDSFNGVFYSNDFGANWNNNILSLDILDIAVSSSGQYQTTVGNSVGIPFAFYSIAGPDQNLSSISSLSEISLDIGNIIFTQSTTTSTSNLQSCAMSSSGQYLLAADQNGYIWQSSSYGVGQFTTSSTSVGYISISTSGTGEYILASSKTHIYQSTDFGVSFVQITLPSPTFSSGCGVAVSSSGQYQTIAVNDAGIFISSNYGIIFNLISSIILGNVSYCTTSSTGQYQIIVCSNNNCFSSNNFGTTWDHVVNLELLIGPGSTPPVGVSMSASGQYQTVTCYGSNIYISKNFGVVWTTTGGNTNPYNGLNWQSISISATGQYQFAAVQGGSLYISADYGNIFNIIPNTSATSWDYVSISSSGQYLMVVAGTTNIYLCTLNLINGEGPALFTLTQTAGTGEIIITSNTVTFTNNSQVVESVEQFHPLTEGIYFSCNIPAFTVDGIGFGITDYYFSASLGSNILVVSPTFPGSGHYDTGITTPSSGTFSIYTDGINVHYYYNGNTFSYPIVGTLAPYETLYLGQSALSISGYYINDISIYATGLLGPSGPSYTLLQLISGSPAILNSSSFELTTSGDIVATNDLSYTTNNLFFYSTIPDISNLSTGDMITFGLYNTSSSIFTLPFILSYNGGLLPNIKIVFPDSTNTTVSIGDILTVYCDGTHANISLNGISNLIWSFSNTTTANLILNLRCLVPNPPGTLTGNVIFTNFVYYPMSNAGVTSITAGNGISVSAATGPITVSSAFTLKQKSADYTALPTDTIIGLTSLVVSSTVTIALPDPTTSFTSNTLTIVDQSGNASSSSTITISTPVSGTINGTSTIHITSPYGSYVIYSNGTNYYAI